MIYCSFDNNYPNARFNNLQKHWYKLLGFYLDELNRNILTHLKTT